MSTTKEYWETVVFNGLEPWEDDPFKDYQLEVENWYARGNIVRGFHPAWR